MRLGNSISQHLCCIKNRILCLSKLYQIKLFPPNAEYFALQEGGNIRLSPWIAEHFLRNPFYESFI